MRLKASLGTNLCRKVIKLHQNEKFSTSKLSLPMPSKKMKKNLPVKSTEVKQIYKISFTPKMEGMRCGHFELLISMSEYSKVHGLTCSPKAPHKTMKLSPVASVYSSACNHLSSTSEYLELSLALCIGLKKLPIEGTRVPGHYTMKSK